MFFNRVDINIQKVHFLVNSWWPWVDFFNEIFLVQIIITIIFSYIGVYSSIYNTLLYVFILFFLFGISLAIYQLELFTAFLWLIECSVIFVFLLLLFYLNVKNVFNNTNTMFYNYIFIIIYLLYVGTIISNNILSLFSLSLYFVLDNNYEDIFNFLQNDLFVFFLSYYILNNIEFVFIGFLLLIGSIICVNLFLINKNMRVQNYNTFFNIFNFFVDMCSFVFLRKQSLIRQGNTRSSLKIFLKK